LVWVELAPLPFWLEPAAVVDMLVGCSWIYGMLSKVGCFGIDDGGEGLSGWMVKKDLVLVRGLG
jgi:hypothetical protein